MTRIELQENMESFGGMKIPMLVSEIIPHTVPQIVIAGMLFVMLEDGMVSFDIVPTPSGTPQLRARSMKHGEACAAYWRLASHNFHEFERAIGLGD